MAGCRHCAQLFTSISIVSIGNETLCHLQDVRETFEHSSATIVRVLMITNNLVFWLVSPELISLLWLQYGVGIWRQGK